MKLTLTAPLGAKRGLVITASTNRKGLRLSASIRRNRKANRKGRG